MTIAKKIEETIRRSSWVRKMFEDGARLKARHGAENVFDFSLGNPNLPPPERFTEVLRETATNCGPGDHCYMPNTGYPQVCQAVAEYLSLEQGVAVTESDVVMTSGAAGALNVILKAILDPGDEVVAPAPCFVEYGFYVDNHGGVLRTVETRPDFTLDLGTLSADLTPKTKAVLINSPNNPSGQIYDAESLCALGRLLMQKSEAFGRTIYLLSDEPYRKIVYDGATVPGIFPIYPESIIASSYSKDIGIPGERIGYLAVNPAARYREALLEAVAITNRILGFVNAPALMQRVVACLQGEHVDIGEYARKRDLLCEGLAAAGYEFIRPRGAFYLFPKSPIPDDIEFIQGLKEELILAVPGTGFKRPGHFRLAYCVADAAITNAMPGFKRAMDRFRMR